MASIIKTGPAILVVTLLLCVDLGSAQEWSNRAPVRSTVSRRVIPSDAEVSKARVEVMEKIKETRAGAEKLLTLHETERQRRADVYQQRRDLYAQGLIARTDVLQAEQGLLEAMRRVDEDKRWIGETAMRDELLRLPGLAVGGYSETTKLLRFNGASLWSLAQAAKIEKFFSKTF